MSLETDAELNKFVLFRLEGLSHALEANPNKPFELWEEYTSSHTTGGKIVHEEQRHRMIGRLEPPVLRKLKSKVIYAIRGELEDCGETDTADYLIFSRERDY